MCTVSHPLGLEAYSRCIWTRLSNYVNTGRIRITGTGTNTGQNFVNFPGAYTANDAGILLSIYNNNGQPNNGGKAYKIPGPAVLTC
jgi:lytic cellulose monooxygenase (C1-hydroxylating)